MEEQEKFDYDKTYVNLSQNIKNLDKCNYNLIIAIECFLSFILSQIIKKTYFLKKDANSDVNVTANILSIRMKPSFTHL